MTNADEDDEARLPYERDVLKVRVVAHEGMIVIVPFEPEKDIKHQWWPTGGKNGNNLGCVIGDSKKMLGCSREALDLMRRVKKNHDAVGDLGWWRCNDGQYAFSWWGPIFRIVDPAHSEADRDFHVHEDQCTIIPNDVPEEAKKAIAATATAKKKAVSWKQA
jgi:hypothetical protein